MRSIAYRRLGVEDPVARAGFEVCRQATRRTGEIEYAVTLLLPPVLRVALWALYGAARVIDDLAEAQATQVGGGGLDEWIGAFERDLAAGGSEDPVRAALLHTVTVWQLPPGYLQTVFQGQRADAAGRQFASWDQWYQYVALVNAPFVVQTASMFVQNAGLSVSLRHADGAFDMWQNLARAVNLTDALADLAEDGANRRLRLPGELLDRFGMGLDDLFSMRRTPALHALIRHLTDTARRWFDNSPRLPPILHPGMGIALNCYIELHRMLLDTIEAQSADPPHDRVTLGSWRTRRLLLPARARAVLAWSLFPSPLYAMPRATATLWSATRDQPCDESVPPARVTRSADPRAPRLPTAALPRHVAVIMDGNGRWADSRGLTHTDGHRAGISAQDDVIAGALEIVLPYLTVYAFSTENWKRPADEVGALMHVLPYELLQQRADNWHTQGVRVRWAGQRAGLPLDMVSVLTSMADQTGHNTQLTLTLCVNYGGRAEIAAAGARLATDALAGRITPGTVSEHTFGSYLYLPDLPDVDLLIRTGGEKRCSNFLPWQSIYSELVFLDVPWPECDRRDLWDAVVTYAERTRRFGMTWGSAYQCRSGKGLVLCLGHEEDAVVVGRVGGPYFNPAYRSRPDGRLFSFSLSGRGVKENSNANAHRGPADGAPAPRTLFRHAAEPGPATGRGCGRDRADRRLPGADRPRHRRASR